MHRIEPHVVIFSGGGSRGFLHYGFVRALFESGLPVEQYDGISIGSWGAAFCGLGLSLDQMREATLRFDISRLLNVRTFLSNVWRHGSDYRGLFDSRAIEAEVDAITRGARFRDCPHKVRIQATDLATGQPFVFSQETTPDAPLAVAVSASSALTGIFQPVTFEGRTLVDGSYCGTWLTAVGPTIISNVSPLRETANPARKSIVTLLMRSYSILGQYLIDEVRRRNPQVLEIQHDTRGISMLQRGVTREQRLELMERSYTLCAEAIAQHVERLTPQPIAAAA